MFVVTVQHCGQTVCGLPQRVTKVSICFNKLTPVRHIVGRNKQKKDNSLSIALKSLSFKNSVPRAGVEPARVAPLVFETSASTDSAIWAMVFAKERAASKNLQLLVPRPGIEPGWIAPLVFETSASTDSAIWAIAGAKVQIKIEIANFLVIFFLKKQFQGRKKLKMCFISPILY